MNIQGVHPTMSAPIQAQSASGASSSGGGTSSSQTSGSDLQSTFLNLLVTELQNQDPTTPVDPTQMVGQMVSLNELDQLISINQTLTQMSTAVSSSFVPAANASVSVVRAANPEVQPKEQHVASSIPMNGGFTQSSASSSAASSIPGFMNLYGSFSAPITNSISNPTGAR